MYKDTSHKVLLRSHYNFVETPRKFIVTKLSSISSDLNRCIVGTDEDPSLRTESFAMKLNLVFSQDYTKIYVHQANTQGTLLYMSTKYVCTLSAKLIDVVFRLPCVIVV